MAGKPKRSSKKGGAKHNAMVVPRPHGPVTVMGKHRVGDMPGEAKKNVHVPKAVQAALDQSHTFAALITSGVMGYLEGRGTFDEKAGGINIPTFGLNKEAILGVGAFFAGKYMKNQMVDHMATGLLSVGAWKLGFKSAREGATPPGEVPVDIASGAYDEAHEAF